MYGKKIKLSNFKKVFPSLGSYKVLLNNKIIKQAIIDNKLHWYEHSVIKNIKIIQTARNQAAHQGQVSLEEIKKIRDNILGIEEPRIISGFLNRRLRLAEQQN